MEALMVYEFWIKLNIVSQYKTILVLKYAIN